MDELTFLTLRQRPELKEEAAAWFHGKWGVPTEAYLACMDACLSGETAYDWYLCLAGGRIVGGLGVIENDFHDRKDLAPNVCAVYTEPSFRGRGIAGRLLELAVEDGKIDILLVKDLSRLGGRPGRRDQADGTRRAAPRDFLCKAKT